MVGNNFGKLELMPHKLPASAEIGRKECLCFKHSPGEGPASH